MKSLLKALKITSLAAILTIVPLAGVGPVGTPAAQAQSAPNIVIPKGQAITVDVPGGITTIVMGNKEIATAVAPNSSYAIITALQPGVTNMLIWTGMRRTPINYVIEVSENARQEQVAVKVKVLEVDVASDGKLGVDWSDFISFKEAMPNMPFRLGLPVRTSTLDARIDTLVNDRKARILAEPTLVVLNGKDAEFLSGGELPMVVTDRDRINIQWRQFGVSLKVKAALEGSDTVQMTLTPEVSDLDKVNSVTIANQLQGGSFVIPAFKTRRAQTTLRVNNNQTIVIAGLLQNTKSEVEQKIPLLGNIPVLGYLFKTVDFQERKSELVFIVTPTIVQDPLIKPEADYGKDANVKN